MREKENDLDWCEVYPWLKNKHSTDKKSRQQQPAGDQQARREQLLSPTVLNLSMIKTKGENVAQAQVYTIVFTIRPVFLLVKKDCRKSKITQYKSNSMFIHREVLFESKIQNPKSSPRSKAETTEN